MLARIPFWGWYLLITLGLYLVYNPVGFSTWHMWADGDMGSYLPFKVLGTLLLLSFLGVIVYGTITTMSVLGLVVLVGLIAAVLWSVYAVVAFDFMGLGFWSWAAQPLLGTVITVGWQWPKIWRRGHGTVTVEDPDTPT